MDFLDRLDPELLPTVEAAPELDLSGDLPKLRAALERVNAPLRARASNGAGRRRHGPRGERRRLGSRVRAGRPNAGDFRAAVDPRRRHDLRVGRRRRLHVPDLGAEARRRHRVGRVPPGARAPVPGAVEDGHAGLVWLADHADELGIDRSRIAIGGASAGGGVAAGTALLAGTAARWPVAFQMLVFPMIDDRDSTSSMRRSRSRRCGTAKQPLRVGCVPR